MCEQQVIIITDIISDINLQEYLEIQDEIDHHNQYLEYVRENGYFYEDEDVIHI